MMKRWGSALLALAILCVAALACAEGDAGVKATVQEATVSEATPAEATPAEATPAEATASEAMPALPDGLGERILRYGLKGDDVARMQERLYELGYYDGEIDGSFGRKTRSAVYAFQRAHGLAKVDGKAGPETLGRLFSDDVIVRPTPTPSPTPTPAPTPTPTPTPTPSPAPSPTPDVANAPFAIAVRTLVIGGNETELMLGEDEQGEALYPLCGVFTHLGFDASGEAGSWQLARETDGREIALMTDGQKGFCESAMLSVDGVILLMDAERRVAVYGGEAYVTRATLEACGLDVQEEQETVAIEEADGEAQAA